jgi:glycine/D-amino acid oxidase-like deaminating enzyme
MWQGVAEAMAEGLEVRFGHEVDRIEWGRGGVIVSCSGGQVIEADAAIVTVSLGVLKVPLRLFHCTSKMSGIEAGALFVRCFLARSKRISSC